jgi:hypothetical protein
VEGLGVAIVEDFFDRDVSTEGYSYIKFIDGQYSDGVERRVGTRETPRWWGLCARLTAKLRLKKITSRLAETLKLLIPQQSPPSLKKISIVEDGDRPTPSK